MCLKSSFTSHYNIVLWVILRLKKGCASKRYIVKTTTTKKECLSQSFYPSHAIWCEDRWEVLCVTWLLSQPSPSSPSFEVKDIPQLFKQSAVWTRETEQNYPGGSQKSWLAGSRPKTAGTPLSWAGWCGAGRTGRLRHRCRICCGSLHPWRDRRERKMLDWQMFQSCLCYITLLHDCLQSVFHNEPLLLKQKKTRKKYKKQLQA